MALAERVIEYVKHYPILFNFSHEDYRNTQKKDKVWAAIAAELNEDPEDVKKKWKNLRDTFLRYSKGKKSKNGKKWQWALHMETFKPALFGSKMRNTNQSQDEYSQMTSTENLNLDPIATESMETSFDDSVFVDFRNTSESADAKSFSRSTPLTKEKQQSEYRLTSSLESLIKHLKGQIHPELDETDLLFLAHARNIKTFSKKRQAIAKMKISQVIMEQELENLEDQVPENHDPGAYHRSLACSSSTASRSQQHSPYREFIEFQDSKPSRDD